MGAMRGMHKACQMPNSCLIAAEFLNGAPFEKHSAFAPIAGNLRITCLLSSTRIRAKSFGFQHVPVF